MSRAKRQIKPPQYLNEYELEEHSQLPKILQKVQKKSTNRLQDITSIVCGIPQLNISNSPARKPGQTGRSTCNMSQVRPNPGQRYLTWDQTDTSINDRN